MAVAEFKGIFDMFDLHMVCCIDAHADYVETGIGIKEVVFALRTPHMGGYSRWDILQDQGLARYTPVFSSPPNVITGILEKEAAEQFEKAGWTIHRD